MRISGRLYEIFISEKPEDGRDIRSIDGLPVIRPIQIHGTRVHIASKSALKRKADGLITDRKNFWIGVLAADCLPAFLVGNGMVGVVHAGWRGTAKGILFNAIKKMQVFTKVISVILGPCICSRCYEVGLDVYNSFSASVRDKVFKRISDEKFLLDLRKANRIQARSAGVKSIEDIPFCTVCDNELFYSFRKEKTKKRTLYAIRLISPPKFRG